MQDCEAANPFLAGFACKNAMCLLLHSNGVVYKTGQMQHQQLFLQQRRGKAIEEINLSF